VHKVLLFIAFLVVYIFYGWVSYYLTQKNKASLRTKVSFWRSELTFLVGYLFFFVSLYLLSGLWISRLVVFFLGAGQVAVVISAMFGALFAKRDEKFFARVFWASLEASTKHLIITAVLSFFAFLFFLVFPVAVGIVYFKHTIATPEMTVMITRCLILMQFTFYPVSLLLMASLLASENLDNDSRRHLFIDNLVGMIPTSLFLALGLWAFGIGERGANISLNLARQVPLQFSVHILVFLAVFFGLVTVVPYLVGSLRAKEWHVVLLGKEKAFVAAIADVLRKPLAASYTPRLTDVRQKIAAARTKLTEEDAGLRNLEEFRKAEGDNAPKDLQDLVWAADQSRSLDPRMKYEDALIKLEGELQEIVQDLQTRDEASQVEKASKWAQNYDSRKNELTLDLETTHKTKPTLMIGIGTAATWILSAVLSEVGKQAWAMLKR